MQIQRHRLLHLAAGVAAAFYSIFLSSHGAWSQAAGTIKVVTASPPGGVSDFAPRLLTEQISRAQGVTMVIENRPGAGGIIASEAVSRAKPDGNTVLFMTNAFVINPHLRKVNYNPLTSFEPVCYLFRGAYVVVVNAASSYHTLADLLTGARAKPGDLTMASFGPGTSYQLAIEMLKRAANVNMTFVPYPGTGPAVTALLGEHVTSAFVTYFDAAEQVKAGKLRALAVASQTRIPALPDVPTVAEAGYKDFEAEGWAGLVAPAKTPKEAISQLAGWFTAAMQVPEVKAKIATQEVYPVGMCGADFGAFLRKQYDDYGRVIREADIRAE
jgi:tripartite-type tricarboxylate transporter receptor subunit TctC